MVVYIINISTKIKKHYDINYLIVYFVSIIKQKQELGIKIEILCVES